MTLDEQIQAQKAVLKAEETALLEQQEKCDKLRARLGDLINVSLSRKKRKY